MHSILNYIFISTLIYLVDRCEHLITGITSHFRILGRTANSNRVRLSASNVQYEASGNNVKVYIGTTRNGIQNGGREYNKVQ